uniref:Uncharacterized protein n=1 Tax=Salix viminalis TaxID=40686 RepID=A0A6N2MUC3_SALVM
MWSQTIRKIFFLLPTEPTRAHTIQCCELEISRDRLYVFWRFELKKNKIYSTSLYIINASRFLFLPLRRE